MSELGECQAVVTGAARGNGFAIAATLLERGYEVWLFDVDDDVRAASERLSPSRAHPVVVDVGDPEAVDRAFDAVESSGRVTNLLVNNAGVMPQAPFIEVSKADYTRTLRVNLDGVFWCSQRFARSLVAAERGGCIVNVSSMAARIAPPNTSAYCASKGGVSSLTRAMAIDLGRYGIRVNEVAPGVILTDMNRHLFDDAGEHEARVLARVALGRTGVPDDVATAVAFLASPDADYVTGTSLPIDGGYLAR